MSMLEWAKREIDIASKRERGDKPESEWDYGCACYDSALRAFESLLGDEHSGFSIGLTKQILNRLIDGKPLTPIEDIEDTWGNIRDVSRHKGEVVNYQCKRMSSLFKYVYADGTVKYSDLDRQFCTTKENPSVSWHNGFVRSVYDEMYPITMPYMPNTKPDEIICEELLTDRKNGDYDTMAILYINRANGERVEVNRYFKEDESSFTEISKEEYKERQRLHEERLSNEEADIRAGR